MLTVMLLALAAFAYWYALVTPLRLLRDGRQARYDRSVDALRDATASAAAIRSLRDGRPRVTGADLSRIVLDAATSASVPLGGQRRDGDGRLTVTMEPAPAAAVFAWLDRLRQRHGIAPVALTLKRTPDGISGEATFGNDL